VDYTKNSGNLGKELSLNRDRSKGIVGIFILVTVLFFIFIMFAFFTVSKLKETDSIGQDLMESSAKSPIAVIPIEGEIRESKKVIEMLLSAEESKDIKAIILRIDSPGGAVAPTQEIYEEVIRIDKTKPVYSSFGSVAASGGYYIGAATRKIYANSGTLTGSIGVIMQTADLSELFKWAKFKQETIKAGRLKDIGNPGRPMTDEERMFLNDLLSGTHKQFMEDIIKVRGKRLKKDILDLAQGQIFHGKEAMEYGLVDEIGSLWQAGRAIHKEMKFKGKFALRFMKPAKKKFSISDFLEETEDTLSHIKSQIKSENAPAFLFRL
jgi:protease-4